MSVRKAGSLSPWEGVGGVAIRVCKPECALQVRPRANAMLACVALAANLGAAHAQPTDAIDQPLTTIAGDRVRGRAIVASRQVGLCLLCHPAPIPEERFQGNLAPDLAGAGSRLTAGQLRLRIVDARRLNPQTIMPPYRRTDGLQRVGAAWQGKPLLSAQQVEDVVAWLVTLDRAAP